MLITRGLLLRCAVPCLLIAAFASGCGSGGVSVPDFQVAPSSWTPTDGFADGGIVASVGEVVHLQLSGTFHTAGTYQVSFLPFETTYLWTTAVVNPSGADPHFAQLVISPDQAKAGTPVTLELEASPADGANNSGAELRITSNNNNASLGIVYPLTVR